MIPLFLAQSDPMPSWILVIGLGQLLSLGISAMQFIQLSSGRSRERQVEPTAVATLAAKIDLQGGKIDGQTTALSALNREIGAMASASTALASTVEQLSAIQREDITGAHKRIDELSKEVARHDAEISAIQRNCDKCS